MSDHADHHHAAPAKPNATTTMSFALFIGMVTIIVTLVGAIRGSDTILTIGLITGIASIAVAVLAVLILWWLGKAHVEEQFLRQHYPGYSEYCTRVRHRLIPGLL